MKRSAAAAATPTTMTKYRLVGVKTIGAPLTFIAIVTVRFTRNATPVTMVAPNCRVNAR